MYAIPDSVIYDPPLLLKFMKKHGITRVLFTPSLLGKRNICYCPCCTLLTALVRVVTKGCGFPLSAMNMIDPWLILSQEANGRYNPKNVVVVSFPDY